MVIDTFYNFRIDRDYFCDVDNDTLNYLLTVKVNDVVQDRNLEWINFDDKNL